MLKRKIIFCWKNIKKERKNICIQERRKDGWRNAKFIVSFPFLCILRSPDYYTWIANRQKQPVICSVTRNTVPCRTIVMMIRKFTSFSCARDHARFYESSGRLRVEKVTRTKKSGFPLSHIKIRLKIIIEIGTNEISANMWSSPNKEGKIEGKKENGLEKMHIEVYYQNGVKICSNDK